MIDAMKQAFKTVYGHEPTEDSFLWAGFQEGYRAAIEAAEKQEPVAVLQTDSNGRFLDCIYRGVALPADQFLWKEETRIPRATSIRLFTTPQPAIPEWQPIETAPKDGTYFLCFNGNWRGLSRYWEPNYEDDPIWVDETTEFISPPPTHWMPLPAAPKPENSHE